MRKTMRTTLLAAAALTSASLPAQTPTVPSTAAARPDADPALWVVKDDDTTIYLFGTFHALDGKTDWFNDEVKAAFERSGQVYLEVLKPEDPSAMQPLMAKHALSSGDKPLSAKLSARGKTDLTAALAGLGAPPTAFDQFKPFFAAMMLAVLGAQKLGFTGEQGAEAIITAAARQSGKPIDQLETMEFQIGLFDKLPEAEQIRMLEYTAATMKDLPATFGRMTRLWNAGDADGFATLVNEMQSQSPAMFELLLTNRNATWAGWVEKRLKTPGTVFVAVGAGHLAGKDSVQDHLGKKGIKSARVNY